MEIDSMLRERIDYAKKLCKKEKNNWGDFTLAVIESMEEQLTLGDVSQQRELLLAYEQSKCPKTWWMSKNQAECEVDYFIANNCG